MSASGVVPDPDDVVRLRHEAGSVPIARRRLRSDLSAVGVPSDVVSDVEVVLSELLGNSVRHARAVAGGVVLVGWRVTDDGVYVRVTDGGSDSPIEAREPTRDEASGRGLRIVERLAAEWGVVEHAGALRSVWAAVPMRPRATLRVVR